MVRRMRPVTLRPVSTALLLTAVIAVAGAIPGAAGAGSRFDQRMEVTAEADAVDPAIERRYTAAFSRCQAHAGATPENAACFEAEFGRQDARLNAVWRATLRRLSPADRGDLREAQRRWIEDRDPFCRKTSDDFSGGTIAPVVYVSCRVELTIRRTLWLEQLR